MLKIYVHCDRLHKIQRIVFVERKCETTFRVKLRSLRMRFDFFRVVLARGDINFWIMIYFEPISSKTVGF